MAVAISPTQPRMISVGVSPYCELARWTMERLDVAYTEDGETTLRIEGAVGL